MLLILEILYCAGPTLQSNGNYIHYDSWQVSLVLTRSHRSGFAYSIVAWPCTCTSTNSSSDLTRDASIRYASDSITVVLGYQPVEVLDRSCWDYFHPQELPFARSIHGRSVRLDKAAVLNYCSIRHKDGSWVCCECVFTVVYDVLIASTTIYGGGNGSQSTFASGFPYTEMLQRNEIVLWPFD